MAFRLTKAQRWLAIGLATVIALALFQQVDEYGLDETPWLIGLLVIGGLLFAAFSPSSTEARIPKLPPKRQTATKDQTDALANLAETIPKLDERFGPIERLYNSAYDEWSAFFSSSVVDRMSQMSRSDMNHMRKFSELAAIGMSFANLIFFIKGEQAQRPSEDRKIDGHVARVLATKMLAKQIQHTLDTGPAVLPPIQKHPDVIRSMAMKKLENLELAVNESLTRYTASFEFPFDPLFAAIDQEAHFKLESPKAREDFFGIKFRQELGRLVQDADF